MNHIDKIIERECKGFIGDETAACYTAKDLRALLQEVTEEYRKDAERLDFLDTNLRFSIGWNVSRAPKGNVVVRDVVFLGTNKPVPIREAIDTAIRALKEKA